MKTGKGAMGRLQDLTSDFFRPSGWRPKADVYRCKNGLLVKLELAGVAEQDVSLTLQRGLLIVEGKRRDWCVVDTQASLSMEITYDWFRRTIKLPIVSEAVEMHYEYRNGMLLVHLKVKG